MLLTSAANNETREFYNSSKCVANLLKVCDPKASAAAASLLYFPLALFFSPPIEVQGKNMSAIAARHFLKRRTAAAPLVQPFSEIIFRPAAEPRAGSPGSLIKN
jgi:hypothetical protein